MTRFPEHRGRNGECWTPRGHCEKQLDDRAHTQDGCLSLGSQSCGCFFPREMVERFGNRDGMDSNASTDGGLADCSPDPALLLHSLVFRSSYSHSSYSRGPTLTKTDDVP